MTWCAVGGGFISGFAMSALTNTSRNLVVTAVNISADDGNAMSQAGGGILFGQILGNLEGLSIELGKAVVRRNLAFAGEAKAAFHDTLTVSD